ncbi:alpha N-terminal protein methyltransferase 1A-like [Tropilaelaps mercedesae]|uniref:Alpha N-terminal protein methyltransferase 1 n=1 Tax=Tropilaelaps mercedesae TaxID=418985 RepID=A0A1V9XF60_9ACAR|nr:alpha N-terminal protein methyltransferase 1A-like [Tropilaelaps mercedesae]
MSVLPTEQGMNTAKVQTDVYDEKYEVDLDSGTSDYVGNQERPSFYADGAKYWEGIEPTIEGMLGGFAQLSDIDVGASRRFLKEFCEKRQHPTGTLRALDCGSGIGRVTKMMLSHIFNEVDMLEQNQQFLDKADDYLGECRHKVGRKICSGLQSFIPDPQRPYDVIWVQWVTGHLTDTDFVEFLRNAANGLRENGLICVKDNLSSCSVEMDNKDSSVTRPRSLVLEIFRKANLRLVGERKQIRFPKGLYEVKMFALKPKKTEVALSE